MKLTTSYPQAPLTPTLSPSDGERGQRARSSRAARTLLSSSAEPLRVAIVSSSLKLAGAEKQTVYMTRALKEAGVDVRFFHLGERGHYEAVLRRMGVHLLQIYKRKRPMFILARLSQALWRFRPQIVFAPQFGDLLQAGLAGRLCGALVLGGVRSDGFYELNSNGWRSRWMLRLAQGLIANSHHGKQNLASLGTNPSKMKVLPNVLDLAEFDKRSKMPAAISIPPDRVMAVGVGRLEPSKRFDHFLSALALARRKAPALLGVIAGSDCGSRRALEQQANQIGLAPNHVVFLGECYNVPSLLAQAGFLVVCSEYEGFPNVILEAMAARLPVISTPVGDAERIVLQNQTGFVVAGDCVETVADRMAELALSPATRTRLGMGGRKNIEQNYDYQSLATRLLALFRDFAAERGRRQVAVSIHAWLAEQSDGSASTGVRPSLATAALDLGAGPLPEQSENARVAAVEDRRTDPCVTFPN